MDVTTDPFRIFPSAYAAAIMRQWLLIWWWAVAVLPVGAVIAALATADIRYLMLALVLTCLVIPPALLIVYYYYALDPRARINIPLHTISFDGSTLTITPCPEPSGNSESSEPSESTETSESSEYSKIPDPAPVTLPISAVFAVTRSGGTLRLSLDSTRPAPLLIIPYSAFPSSGTLRQFIAMLEHKNI